MQALRPMQAKFFRLDSGREPVRKWLRSLDPADKKIIGQDIRTVQFGWPLGMPLVRKLDTDLWETRSTLGSQIARVIFTVYEKQIVLLHGFIKKTQKTPKQDLDLAKRRLMKLRKP